MGADEQVSFHDAYWFSYISTTTVGLGDYFLAPEVLGRVDLFIYPILFLLGFVYFSAFLGKFSSLFGKLLQKHTDRLAVRLERGSQIARNNNVQSLDDTDHRTVNPENASNQTRKSENAEDAEAIDTPRTMNNDDELKPMKSETVLSGAFPSQENVQVVDPV